MTTIKNIFGNFVRVLVIALLCSLPLSGATAQASGEDGKTQITVLKRCGLAMAATAVLFAGYVVNANTFKRDGEYLNVGTPQKPSWRPILGPKFFASSRIKFITMASRQGIWLENDKFAYGRIAPDGNRLIYYGKGNEPIAESEPFSPYGRSYVNDDGRSEPVSLSIYDSSKQVIGTIEEHSAPIASGDEFEVYYLIKDNKGSVVGKTASFTEKHSGTRTNGLPWALTLENEASTELAQATRGGMVTSIYKWELAPSTEEIVDPVLLAFTLVMRHYADEHRGLR